MTPRVVPADEKTDLRPGIDHIGVCANFVIHDGQGRVLLQKRSENCRDEQGRWDIGGGAVEFGETIEDAITREIKEELSTVPLEMEFLCVGDAHRKHQQQQTHWLGINYAVRVDPTTVKIGEPHKIDEIGWFTSKNLPSPLHSQFRRSFDVAQQRDIVK